MYICEQMKKELINTALKNLRDNTGVEAFWKDEGPLDGVIEFNINDHLYKLAAKTFNELRGHHITQLQEYIQNINEPIVIFADHIFPKIKKTLRDKNIPYIEANGNIYLNQLNTFLFVDTQRPIATAKKTGNRAFTKTGLKVVFHLLRHKQDINLTQRQLAERTGVGLGNIPQIIEGLKDTGYLIPLKKREYIWENRKELMERWINEYDAVLKPTLRIGRFRLPENKTEKDLDTKLTVWGGEPAAEILTNYLRPENYIIYTGETQMDLMKNYRMIPNKDGEIEVFEKFWKDNDKPLTAPPILVYADLLLEGGKRNVETAEMIFDEYIQPIL
ncbi:hypothetical protein BY457_10587 [Marinilabilia salmonicolor]|nr:hypothetical protein BY457_10587 [Marinilabilia salmonicolor]